MAVCIPSKTCKTSEYKNFSLPGWNTYVKEKHESAREAYLDWSYCVKPKQGYLFDNMKRSRAIFKLAVRYCKDNVEQMRADACANSLLEKRC